MLEKFKRTAFGTFLRRVKWFCIRKLRRLKDMHDKKQPKANIIEELHRNFDIENEIRCPEWDEAIDVIVPIYNGYDYLVNLFECLPRTKMKCRFILVDDKSPDARVKKLEKEFVKKHKSNAVLIENKENLGFVMSVNNGLEKAKGHVALVNTDTELPDMWLERLMLPIIEDGSVASTTPYSNSATIFSFPDFCYNNAIYLGLDEDTIDSYFGKLVPRYTETPTGVGFCMGMNKNVIDKIGRLDYETFGRGFGEENDWCQRARKAGYKNVQVENLFVYHKHGGSFVSAEKEALIADHLGKLAGRYPSYDRQVRKYIEKDKNAQVRNLVQMLIDTHELSSRLYFDHSIGGGATAYLNVKKAEHIKNGGCVTVVRYDYRENNYKLTFEDGRISLEYMFNELEEMLEIGRYLHFDEIYVNELVTYPRLWEVHRLIVRLKVQQNAKLIMLFHDFFAMCPTFNLMGEEGKYCGMPEQSACEQCFRNHGFDSQYECDSMVAWIANWKGFLKECTEVRTFSQDTFDRVSAAYGDGLTLTLVPHTVDYAFPVGKSCKTSDSLNIGLLGVLSAHKGAELVRKLIDFIEENNLNINICLIGYVDGVDKKAFEGHECFRETGRYRQEELPRLIFENDIDIFLITSVWPETFSYTTQEVINMEMPVAVLDMGAPAERVRNYEKGLVLTDDEPITIISEIAQFANETLEVWRYRRNHKKVAYLLEFSSFSSRYRLEHLKEELMYQGVPGEVWETQKLPKNIDWNEIGALLIYRCRYMGDIKGLIEEAKRNAVPVIYDIDDYIFDYEAIKHLAFLESPEYKNYETYSSLIRDCMENSDGIIVSTEYLKRAVRRSFPKKPVYVNRNVASAKMLILSVLAEKNTPKSDRLTLGYFSGSNTHSRDFDLIADVLLEFLKKYENARLKIVGCLELPESFNSVKDQIVREEFVPWEKLPELIASVDINLMPLENTLFHWCKSENKWLEAALVRVPTIGSYNEELAGATVPDENIILCSTPEEWAEGLEKLATDDELRAEIAQKAFEYVVENKTCFVQDEALRDFIMKGRY